MTQQKKYCPELTAQIQSTYSILYIPVASSGGWINPQGGKQNVYPLKPIKIFQRLPSNTL